jgi:hypothetical protein
MPSSTSSSDPRAWRRFAGALLASTLGALALVYAFIVTVDPWGMLPLSPPLPRVPISTNARYSFPALAISPRFDSAIVGTSTSRLLPPAELDAATHARFANLAMNAATPYEQMRMLALFARAHATPRIVMVGVDALWCQPGVPFAEITARGFPDWMYGGSRWEGYLHMLSLYALQEAANQFAVMTGLKTRHYGVDGYTVFTPPDAEYDAARARAHFAAEGSPDFAAGGPVSAGDFPELARLKVGFAELPAQTVKIAFFTPYLLEKQGVPGSRTQQVWAACKQRVVEIARAEKNVVVVDFMRPSAITDEPTHYWDPVHYRVGVAARLAQDLAGAAAGRGVPADDGVVLWPQHMAQMD